MTQKIIPNIWFDREAEEAAEFYASVFPNAEVGTIARYTDAGKEIHKQESGSVMTAEFTIDGFKFIGLNGGPIFKTNPSISFFVNCDSKEEVDELWGKLIEGGAALMPLDAYPFSERFGWVADKFGVSWQLIYGDPSGDRRPRILPSLLFTQENDGKAEEAIKFYTSVFDDAKVGQIARFPEDTEMNKKDSLMFGDFTVLGTWLAAMDGGQGHAFSFNEAISLIVNVDSQEELDRYWDALSAHSESEQCGWLKDKYGISWQIVPNALAELLADPDPDRAKRVMEAMLQMKKLDIAALQAA